jgi:hypothetical protein
MKSRILLVGTALVLMIGTAQAADKMDDAKAKSSAPDMKAVEEAMMKAATPGPEHAFLASVEGQWAATTKTMMDPTKDPEVTHGTSVNRMILGGRYLLQEFKGVSMGMPFEGLGWTAYDNVQKKYVATWIDNMGTGIMTMTGNYDAANKSLVMTGNYPSPVTGEMMNTRSVTRIVSPDQHVFEMYGPGPDGKETKMMEITYDRQGAQQKAADQ